MRPLGPILSSAQTGCNGAEIPKLRQWGQEDQKFKVILSYIMNEEATWAMWGGKEGRKKERRKRKGEEGREMAGGREEREMGEDPVAYNRMDFRFP